MEVEMVWDLENRGRRRRRNIPVASQSGAHASNQPALDISFASPSHPRRVAFLPANSVANLRGARMSVSRIHLGKRDTHLRHSSNRHFPFSSFTGCPVVDKRGVYGSPGRVFRVSAKIIPAMNAS